MRWERIVYMYRFLIWGYGKRGKRFLENCPKCHIEAIIDTNKDLWGKSSNGIPIISYEEYKKKYVDMDIIIAVDDNYNIQNELIKDGCLNFHLLEDCPPEIMGFYNKWISELPIKIIKEKKYVIYGLNLYAFLLREYIFSKFGLELVIIPEKQDMRSAAFIKKYSFVKFEAALKGKHILWASRFENNLEVEQKYIIDVFDFSYQIKEYFEPEWKRIKNYYEGEKCFIVATGPSLKIDDLNKLYDNKIFSFGVNRLYLWFEKTKWRPDYLVVMDDKIAMEYGEEIKKCDVPNKIIGDQLQSFWKGHRNSYKTIHRLHDHVLEYAPNRPKFSSDICKGVYSGRTVIYTCLQIACYLGFKEIYLLGTDHNYSGNQGDASNHFHKDYYKGKIRPDKYVKEKAELAFEAAKNYADKHGIKIYNATRGGKLEIFERVKFDELF